MGNQNISAELNSIQSSAGVFKADVVDEITKLHTDWTGFLHDLYRYEWGGADSCLAFGNTYVAAVEAYEAVLKGMTIDITRYHDELAATYKAYVNQDDKAAGDMNARLAKLDDVSVGDQAGHTAYAARPNLDDPNPTPPPKPTDTSPETP